MRSKIGENKRKEKNYFVEMCRFVFSICLVFHHCRELGGGGVEAIFLQVHGYLLNSFF